MECLRWIRLVVVWVLETLLRLLREKNETILTVL